MGYSKLSITIEVLPGLRVFWAFTGIPGKIRAFIKNRFFSKI